MIYGVPWAVQPVETEANTEKSMRYMIYLTLMTSMSLHAASIHKWTDADGNVSYGDAPPISAKTEDVRLQSAPSNPGKALPRLASPGSEAAPDSEPTATADNDEGFPADQAESICTSARQDMEVIERSNRIKLKDVDGSTRYLTAEEIDDRRTQATADIEDYCR